MASARGAVSASISAAAAAASVSSEVGTSSVGGVLAFGLIGIFVGPVVLAVAYTLLNEWIKLGETEPASVEPVER